MGSGKLNAADRCRFSSRELDSEGNDRDSLEECCGVPDCCRDAGDAQALTLRSLARPPRLELGTPGLEGRCSIQLSYGRIWWGTVSVASLCRLRLVRCCREALGLSGATLATDVIETLHRPPEARLLERTPVVVERRRSVFRSFVCQPNDSDEPRPGRPLPSDLAAHFTLGRRFDSAQSRKYELMRVW